MLYIQCNIKYKNLKPTPYDKFQNSIKREAIWSLNIQIILKYNFINYNVYVTGKISSSSISLLYRVFFKYKIKLNIFF